MNDKKNVIFYIVIAVAVVMIIIVGIILFLFLSNNKENNAANPEASQVTTESAEKIPSVQNTDTALPTVDKDSILRSTDKGQNFETYFRVQANTELGAIDVLTISFHPEVQNKVVVSTYDDGLFLTEDDKNLWKPILFPPQKIYSFILDVKDPDNRAFASGVISGNGRIFRTEDKGANWRAVYAEPGSNTFVSALTQDPRNHDLIMAGTSGGTLIRSLDGGDTWKNIGQKITGQIKNFDYDSTKESFMYFLMNGGKVYHSYDAGLTWLNWEEEKAKEIKNLNEQASKLSREGDKAGATNLKERVTALQERNKTEKTPSGIVFIVADPNDSGVLYAGLSKGLYRSTDYGKYWKPINIIESAEKFPIPSVAINPDDSNEISFVAGNAFYRSVNYGLTWAITPLDKTRNASFVAYDPFDSSIIYLGLSAKK